MHVRFISFLSCITLGLGGAARAQTCAAPITWQPDPNGVPALVADLCALSDSVSLYCELLDSADKNDAIYELTIPPGSLGTYIAVTGSAAGFNPVIFLYNSACAAGTGCAASGDANNPLALAGVAPGTYFLAATAAPADAPGACGTVTLDTNLPVELQSFYVE